MADKIDAVDIVEDITDMGAVRLQQPVGPFEQGAASGH